MAVFAILWEAALGPKKGLCEICHAPGWKQTSMVDPMGPGLKIFCKIHHEEYHISRLPSYDPCFAIIIY